VKAVVTARRITNINDQELERFAGVLKPLHIAKVPLAPPPPRDSRSGSPFKLSKVHWEKPEWVPVMDGAQPSTEAGRRSNGSPEWTSNWVKKKSLGMSPLTRRNVARAGVVVEMGRALAAPSPEVRIA
jgi:hypothetical protein